MPTSREQARLFALRSARVPSLRERALAPSAVNVLTAGQASVRVLEAFDATQNPMLAAVREAWRTRNDA